MPGGRRIQSGPVSHRVYTGIRKSESRSRPVRSYNRDVRNDGSLIWTVGAHTRANQQGLLVEHSVEDLVDYDILIFNEYIRNTTDSMERLYVSIFEISTIHELSLPSILYFILLVAALFEAVSSIFPSRRT